MVKKLVWIFSWLILSLAMACSTPQAVREASDPPDVSQDPVQTRRKGREPIVVTTGDGEFNLTPVAEYRIAAMVVGSKRYRFGWEAQISPLDLALAWGKLTDPEYDTYISYSQANRWYFYRYKAGSPFGKKYVVRHSSNHHIIPATENLRKALLRVEEKDWVYLEGFLINLNGTYKGREVWWKTSLSRNDSGDGSCELFYVNHAQIDGQIYE